MIELEVQPIAYQTKQEMVYYTVRHAIMQCLLKPGRRIIAEEIAQQLKVSHIPVREALQQLQSEGLVENRPHIGATVAMISPESVVEIFTLMEGLELVATRVVSLRISPAQLRNLSDLLEEMDDILAQEEYEDWADLNTKLHRDIAHLTEMRMLEDMTNRVLDHWERVRRYFFSSILSNRFAMAHAEHHAIFAAIQDQHLNDLEQLVKQHNQGALAAYMSAMQQPQ